LPSLSPSSVVSILVGVSACHILSENKVEITCLVLKQNSEPESVSILWQDGFQEEMFAKIVCKCNANTFIQGIPTSQSFSLLLQIQQFPAFKLNAVRVSFLVG
jgi:hypothetical protein